MAGKPEAGRVNLPAPGRRPRRGRGGEARAAVLFLLPAFILLVGVRLLPAISAITESLRSHSLLQGTTRFRGLHNFHLLVGAPEFRNSLRVTGVFLATIVPIQVLIALGLALLLIERLPGVNVARVVIFLPVAAPGAVAAVVWGIG